MTFNKEVIRDLFLSVIFLLSMYGIINNPIVKPKAQVLPGDWSIQLMQHPLLLGLAGHNYLILTDADGEIVSEIHGLATDSQTGKWKYIGTSKNDVLKAWEFNGARSYMAEKKYPAIVLNQGNYDEINSLWNKALDCKDKINEKYIKYPLLGLKIMGNTQNSNSVAYSIAMCAGFNVRHVGLITPGEKKNLLEQ